MEDFMDIKNLVHQQREFFYTGTTRKLEYRLRALKTLQKAIIRYETEIETALHDDLGKAGYESYMTEISIVLTEIRLFIKKLNHWAHSKRVSTPLSLFPAISYTVPEPFGVTLIMSPWNYPFQLAITPLVGAIAAGNTAIIKPASYASATSLVISKMVAECFSPEYVTTVLGGRMENATLLEQQFDFIFFTGSTSVGKVVLENASQHLTPVCLELGGKSPCIIDKNINLKLAAKRIAFGKLINAGQSCVAPDYLLIPKASQDDFVRYYQEAVLGFFGPNPLQNSDYPKIITIKHYERLQGLINGENCVIGGTSANQRIAPTVLIDINPKSPIMQEEIFGPILPILNYDSYDDIINLVRSKEKPLALYLFSNDIRIQKHILGQLSFGGATINDTMMHFASPELGFGGVGGSGMGRYHGYQSFQTFSNFKGIVKRSNRIDITLRYHPYSQTKMAILKKIV
jgi:aldehyde dehydrogenase (NAD+)